MIAFHDPPVVRVGNFQSSTLLIIGIYPSRYHENKFSLFRSTGKKGRRSRNELHSDAATVVAAAVDDGNAADAHYSCIAAATAVLHTTKSPPVYASLFTTLGWVGL